MDRIEAKKMKVILSKNNFPKLKKEFCSPE
jgi:hypothetical protein